MKNQKLHKGNILEKAVRQSGYPITKVAERLSITRATLYNKFREPNLPASFLIGVGEAIYYDFSVDFPELSKDIQKIKENRSKNVDDVVELLKLQKKYSNLLEKYNVLSFIFVKMTNENELYTLKKKINEFITENEEY